MHPRVSVTIDELGLTRREADVVELLMVGGSNQVIASKLRIRPATVRSHLKSVYEKCHVSGRHELMSFLFNRALYQMEDELTNEHIQSSRARGRRAGRPKPRPTGQEFS